MVMRAPLDRYGPQPEEEPPGGSPGGDRFRWLQLLQLALTSALLVMFVYQGIELNAANRRIARLYERLDMKDQSNFKDTSAAIEAQQVILMRRVQELEARVKEAEYEMKSSTDSNDAPSAFQAPPPPTPLP